MPRRPVAMSVENIVSGERRIIWEVDQQIAVDIPVIWLDLQRLAVAGFGLREPALSMKDDAQSVVGLGVICLDLKRLTIAGFSFGKPALSMEDDAQAVMDLGVIRL